MKKLLLFILMMSHFITAIAFEYKTFTMDGNSVSFTSKAEGNAIIHATGDDITIAFSVTKQDIPEGYQLESFNGFFPPAGWKSTGWSATTTALEGDQSVYCGGDLSACYLTTPRLDLSDGGKVIFTYYNLFNSNDGYGPNNVMKVQLSDDGGETWKDLNWTCAWDVDYNKVVTAEVVIPAASDNSKLRWVYPAVGYNQDEGAEVHSSFTLDRVLLPNVYGIGGKPMTTQPLSPANNATEVHPKNLVLKWAPAQFATGYKVYVGTSDAMNELIDGANVGSNLSITIPKAGYETTYCWKVVPYNDMGENTESTTWRFTTQKDASVMEFPYEENFDKCDKTTPVPTGWQSVSTGNYAYQSWGPNSIYPYGSLTPYSYGTNATSGASLSAGFLYAGETATLVSPEFVLPAGGTGMNVEFVWGNAHPGDLYFKYSALQNKQNVEGGNSKDEVRFEIYADGEWKLASYLSENADSTDKKYWRYEKIDLMEYAGKKVQFRWITNSFKDYSGYAALDNFQINGFVAKYNIFYKIDGEVYKTIRTAYCETIIPEEIPTKEGYTFSGWSEIPDSMPEHDVEVNGSFKINKYLLTYKVNGDTIKSDSVAYNTRLTVIPDSVKEGYSFSGWSEIPVRMPANDVVVMGELHINKYLLTYKVDGEILKSDSIVYGTAIIPLEEPQKEHNTFSGWSEIPDSMPAHDVEVLGTFTINKYVLTYQVDGEVYQKNEIEFGADITPEKEPAKDGYTFSGWSWIPKKMPAEDVVVTGSFTINKYKITYLVDGEVYKTYDVVYNSELSPESEPTKIGFTFSGWSWIPKLMPAEDVTISGVFNANTYKITYMIDEDVFESADLDYGTQIVAPEVPSKEGFSFIWSDMPETMPDNDVTVKGTYKIHSHSLTYQVDGNIYKTDSVEYHTTIIPEVAPTKEGYTFSGWSEIPELMPDHSVIITGNFTINSYALIYKVDGEEYKSDSIVYNTNLTLEAEPTKEGYTFSGWSEIPETMPANDVIVTGYFAANKYQLTYKVDGMVYTCDSIEFNTTLIPEEEPTKEGYTFSGWSWIPKTMPSEDVTIIGSFIVNKYTVTFMYGEEVLKVDSVEYGAKIVLPESLNSNRYTLSGWLDVPETMPAHDIILYASYTDGISNVKVEKELKVYNEKGVVMPRMKKGLNIIRYNKGPVKKVFVK